MKNMLCALTLFAVVLGADAQPSPSSTAAAKAEMKKLDWFVGKWQGGGSIQMGPTRHEMSGTEHVQRKLEGLVLVVEGNFKGKGAEQGPSVHQTLGVFYYDEQEKGIRFSTWLADGRRGVYAVEVPDARTVIWSIPTPYGKMRYTIKHDEKGRWVEIGEMTPPGSPTPVKFFEMTLEKAKE